MVSCNWFCNSRKTDSFYFWRYVLVYGRWWDTGEKGPKESDKKWGWVNLQCPPYLPLFSVPLYLPWWYSHGIEFRTLPTKQNNTWPNPPRPADHLPTRPNLPPYPPSLPTRDGHADADIRINFRIIRQYCAISDIRIRIDAHRQKYLQGHPYYLPTWFSRVTSLKNLPALHIHLTYPPALPTSPTIPIYPPDITFGIRHFPNSVFMMGGRFSPGYGIKVWVSRKWKKVL